MRLIDVDKINWDKTEDAEGNSVYILDRRDVCNEPTAYNVDKVVEQLKLTSKTALDLAIKRIPGFRFMAPAFQTLVDECFEETVRIVKAGGNS